MSGGYSWGYSSWNCNWYGGGAYYHGGAYYGNSAWHGGYYGSSASYYNIRRAPPPIATTPRPATMRAARQQQHLRTKR